MMERFSEQYRQFLDKGKTEFEVVEEVWAAALEKGFMPYPEAYCHTQRDFVPGDRLIQNIKGKGLVMAVIGKRPVNEGTKIVSAHTDSPRLDLKPVPVQEDDGMIYLRTHYYGGIKKYQWTCVPLALHGRVCDGSGNIRNIVIGENEGDTKFVITDLLPHLAEAQMSKGGDLIISGEQLKLLCGTAEKDVSSEEKTDKLLKDNFNITSADLRISEFEAVPAWKASDAGLDRSFTASYGQDDRVCVFSAVRALMDLEDVPEYTSMVMLCDQEEVGSENGAGLYSNAFLEMLYDLAEKQNTNLYRVFAASECLAADTICGHDPLYPEATESQNTAGLGKGLALVRYTGRGGKKGNNSADTRLMTKLANIFDKNNIKWQCGEMGVCDAGGGTTVAKCMARWGADVVDIGCPLLSMHSPLEITSKSDLYNLYLGLGAFFADSLAPWQSVINK